MSENKNVQVTPRQKEIIRLLTLGQSADEIARNLRISARTVRAHTDLLRLKLGVPRTRMIPAAYRAATGDDLLAATSPTSDQNGDAA
jgi:DNA-binding CsgD family transcriptional regulator